MTTLAFLGALAAIVVLVLVVEVDARSQLRIQRPTGLFTWITSGNWPAKVGGALIIVGVGALLRFAALQIDVAPIWKLVCGVVIAMALGLGSTFVSGGRTRRAVSLCLGGAAFGVAYLTAYSAFGLFDYVSSPTGLALLGLTSIGAGVYAVTRSALSLAVLSMIGAFLGPAFAVEDPGPGVVYGYYVGASLLTLAMVAIRGWRPLIQLSFLFTLAGGIFFAWTSSYYTPQYSHVMLPMLLLLTAVHVAMPIFERSPSGTRWVERLDLVYMIALPSVVSLLALWIAPTRIDFATELLCLGAIWAIAALGLQLTRGRGVVAHAAIAVVLFGFGVAARFRDLPWEIISLAFAVAALAIAARRPLDRVHDVLAGFVVLFGAIHILMSLAGVDNDTGWVGTLSERLIGAVLIIFAGIVCRRIRQSLDTLLLAVGSGWAVIAIGLELIRHDLATVALVFHGISLLLVLSLWIPGRYARVANRAVVPLAIAVVATGVWAAMDAATPVAWVLLFVAPLALIGVAVRPASPEGDSPSERSLAVVLSAAVAAVWGFSIAGYTDYTIRYFPLACAAVAALVAIVVGRQFSGVRGGWVSDAADALGFSFAVLLLFSTAVSISRDISAIALEVTCLAGLACSVYIRRAEEKPINLSTAAFIVAFGLVMQANLMRIVGPPGDQNILGILDLKFPAVTSLLWATAGSALTIWSRKATSRALWVSGAVLLVASAVKLVLLDFGSLGQLANILAVIAAGGMFLLVGWLAPMPPAAPAKDGPSTRSPPTNPAPEPSGSTRATEQPHTRHGLYEYAQAQSRQAERGDLHVSGTDNEGPMSNEEMDASNRRTAWAIGIVAAVIILLAAQGARHAFGLLHLMG